MTLKVLISIEVIDIIEEKKKFKENIKFFAEVLTYLIIFIPLKIKR